MPAPRAEVHRPAGRGGPATRPPRGGGPGRRPRRLPSLLAALASLVALAALLAGVPALLLLGTRAVAGMGVPEHGGFLDLLTRPDDGRLFLWALVAVGWIAWLCFAVSVLLEIPAQLRGRVARRIPALGWSQRAAAGLVGAVLALLPAAGSAFASAPGHAPAAITAAPQHAALTAAPAADGRPAADAAAADRPVYTVRDARPADSLWSIAERQLGSGERWQEIARLNDGRVMDDSGRRFDADRPIHPGWRLLMPRDAKPDTDGAARSEQHAPRHETATVRPGDTLSAIAQRELGDADAWPKLYAANKGTRAPDGERLTDPDLITPGMVLELPGAHHAAPPAATPPARPSPPPA
ncbi:LysM peptidoglycan-binding domain-containing protein, partial [Streptacidiphilus griseoplanus]|uniref:LysM peptidoglycan-binding domain-containing protein n=1 Tax=Peterkaempfera griseoplana TaxID=66896 RepID=UPI000AA34608